MTQESATASASTTPWIKQTSELTVIEQNFEIYPMAMFPPLAVGDVGTSVG